MNAYTVNLRKRIIYIIVGVVVSYFNILPLGMLYLQLSHSPLPDPVFSYFFFNGIRIGIMILFLYLALVHTKPSLVPRQKKYQKLALVSIVVVVVVTVALPSGYGIPEWEQGGCITKSGSYDEDGRFSGSTSQGITTESECIENCIFSGKLNTREEKFCEFVGLFGKTHWETTPEKIAMGDKPIFGDMVR